VGSLSFHRISTAKKSPAKVQYRDNARGRSLEMEPTRGFPNGENVKLGYCLQTASLLDVSSCGHFSRIHHDSGIIESRVLKKVHRGIPDILFKFISVPTVPTVPNPLIDAISEGIKPTHAWTTVYQWDQAFASASFPGTFCQFTNAFASHDLSLYHHWFRLSPV